MLSRHFPLLILLLLAPLTKAQVDPLANDGKVRIYVYRYSQFTGQPDRVILMCDDKDVAEIRAGRYLMLALSPGKHQFRSSKESRINLDLKEGMKYYIRIEIAAGFMVGHGRLALVPVEQGEPEVQQLKPSEKYAVKQRDRLCKTAKRAPRVYFRTRE